MTIKDLTNQFKEEFRTEMANYFYLTGDQEMYEDICTESEERLIIDAYMYGQKFFRECSKEITKNEN